MKLIVHVFVLILVSSCSTNKPVQSFDKQGHRGCRGLMPENTIPAMIRAVELGVTTLEFDIAFSADSQAVLSHEPFFNHEITTRPDGSPVRKEEEKSLNLFRMKYDEIRKYDVGMRHNPRFPRQQKMKAYKPLFADVIDSVEKFVSDAKAHKMHYNIETKTTPATDNIYHPEPAVFVNLLMKAIDNKKIRERVVIQSFDIRTLQILHSQYPDVKTSLLIEPQEFVTINQKIKRLGFNPDIVSPEYRMVTSGIVNDLHQRSMKVIPWTVNERELIKHYKDLGVDGVITDYPDLY